MQELLNPMLIPLKPHDSRSKRQLVISIPGIRQTTPEI